MSNYPNIHDVDTVACVGTGTIGGGWAAYFLAMGYRVQAWDPSPDAAEKLGRLINAAWPALIELGLAPTAHKDNWSVHTELADAVAGVGFIQESAPEDLELKRELLAKIDAAAAPGIVVGSSTSGYGMTEKSTRAASPARLVVGHPFNPPYLIPLVEVAGGEGTDPAAVAWASQWYEFIGKSVITMDREVPGFIANRLQEALWREALHMVDNGEATVAQIDLAITDGPGLRWPLRRGPPPHTVRLPEPVLLAEPAPHHCRVRGRAAADGRGGRPQGSSGEGPCGTRPGATGQNVSGPPAR